MYTYEERLKIREAYKNWKPYTSPYAYHWNGWDKMTPIENNIWADIRYLTLPFYPEFPIGKYFADFADPLHKIVIEVDGKDHEKQKNQDIKRQADVMSLGWDVYRITGRESYDERVEALYEIYNLFCANGWFDDRPAFAI